MIPSLCCDLGTFSVCVFKSPYHHYQTASTSVNHRAQLDLIQDFTLPSLDHNFQYIYFNQKPSLQVTNTRFLCGYIWLNHDTKTWIPSMWCRKSRHINLCSSIHTLIMLKSAVGISTLYMILGGQKRNLPSDIHALRNLCGVLLESPIASLNLLHFHLYICRTVIMRQIHI